MAKILKIAFFWVLSTVMMFSAALAAVTVNDPSYDTTTVDTGTTRTVSVTMSTDSGSATISSFSVSSSPSGLTTSSVDTPFTVGTSGTTKTFTMSSSTANTYTFSVTVVDSNGASSSSGSATIEYVNPSSLTMTILEDPLGTVYEGNNTGMSVSISNTLGSSQTRNLTLYQNKSNTFNVNVSIGSDTATQTLTLLANAASTITWNITIGSFTGIGHAIIRLGDTTESKVWTLTKGTTTTTSSSATTTAAGGSSGSGGTTTTTTTTTTTVRGPTGHEIQNVVRELVQRKNEEIKSLLDSKEELQTGLRIALGKELSAEIKALVAETTEKVQKNVASNRTIDVDTVNLKSTISLKVKYNGTEKINDFIIKDVIPKSFADSASKITTTAPGAIINVTKSDPEYIFTYSNTTPGEEKTITYSTNERVFTVASEYSAPIILAGSTEVYVAPTTTLPGTVTTTLGSAEKGTLTFVAAVVLILAGLVWYYRQNYGKKQPWQPAIKAR